MMPNCRRTALSLVEILVVVAILGVLLALLLPAVQAVRAAAQRTMCQNNLKQLGIALHSYSDSYGRLPPGCSYQNGADPQPSMSWLARLLPFLEEESVWQDCLEAFRQASFFEEPPHRQTLARVMKQFLCPADERSQVPHDFGLFSVAFTDYLGVEGSDLVTRDGTLFLDSSLRILDILDGTSSTVLAGERPPSSDFDLGWWYAGWGQLKTGSAEMVLGVREIRVHQRYRECPAGPYSFSSTSNDVCDAFHFWSRHPGGANFAFSDGSVRFLSYSADPIMPALASRAGGEAVAVPD